MNQTSAPSDSNSDSNDAPWTADDFEQIAYNNLQDTDRDAESIEEAKVWALLAISMRLAGPGHTLGP